MPLISYPTQSYYCYNRHSTVSKPSPQKKPQNQSSFDIAEQPWYLKFNTAQINVVNRVSFE